MSAEFVDWEGLLAATAGIPDSPLEYTADGRCIIFRDPESGRVIDALDKGSEGMEVRDYYDVSALVAENAAIRAELAGSRHTDGMSLVARLPINVYHNRLAEAFRQRDKPFIRKWLSDTSHAAFRVRGGNI